MKILLCHMWMVIGGAETHIVELSRELAARGHDVTVASNGGVWVDALLEGGVKHVNVPLHTKRPDAVLQSYRRLKALIEKERFDIVHAHSRIPAYVCGMLAKRMGFRFITTTHFVFKVNPLLSRISDWGDHTFAVSCDIKDYLMKRYRVHSDNISLTINGIDTVKFSSAADPTDTMRELSLDKGKYRVLHVSRIDDSTVEPALRLCESALALSKEIPNLEVLIVGGGNAFDKLRACADKVNAELGRDLIRLVGPRTDIAKLCATADVFVGVSRAALEAMSCEVPTVLVGPLGYGGVLREDILEAALSTNFCFRDMGLAKTADITRDILSVYRMQDGELEACRELGRRVVTQNYSVAKMADDHLAVYEKMKPFYKYKRGDVIISGYYGFNNVGDDSLLGAMIDGIRARMPEARITVLSKNPKKLAALRGVRTINRFNLPLVEREMRSAKLLISGGGSLLQDGTSKKSLFYYITIMRMAKRHGLKLMLYSNGLGPLMLESSRKAAADIISKADVVTLRESASGRLARELGVTGELSVSADPAFLVKPSDELWCDHIKNREGISDRYFIVSVKEGNNFGERGVFGTVDVFANDLRAICDAHSLQAIIVPMHENRDLEVSRELASKLGNAKLICTLSASEIMALIEGAQFVVGMRLHMLIFAAAMGVPMVGVSYDPKIDAFLEYMSASITGLDLRAADVRTLENGQIAHAIEELMLDDEAIRKRLASLAPMMRELAKEDIGRVIKLLED